MCTNCGNLVLQIGAALFYYRLGQTLLQIGAASLLQIGASDVANCDSYYKLGQFAFYNSAAITNWDIAVYRVLFKYIILRKYKYKKVSTSRYGMKIKVVPRITSHKRRK